MFRSIGLRSETESAYYAQLSVSVSEEYSFLKKAFEENMDIANSTYNTMKMETPGVFRGTRADVEAYIREFYAG